MDELPIGRAFGAAWEMTKRHFLTLLGVFVLIYALAFGVAIGIGFLALVNEDLAAALGAVYRLGASLILQSGTIAVALKVCDGHSPRLEDFLCEWRVLAFFFVEMLLLGSILTVGFLFLIVPGVYLFLRMGWCFYFIVDRGLDPIEALKASWEMTRGRAGQLFLYFLLCAAVVVCGFLALVVGLIPAWCVTGLATAWMYRTLSEGRIPGRAS